MTSRERAEFGTAARRLELAWSLFNPSLTLGLKRGVCAMDAKAYRATRGFRQSEASPKIRKEQVKIASYLASEASNVRNTLNAIERSTTWRMPLSLRRVFRLIPMSWRQLARRVLKQGWWTVTLQLPARRRAVAEVTNSGLFDPSYYLKTNPDVAAAGVNPLMHFLKQGWTEGRDPNPLFDTSYYLETNPDVAAGGLNPLMHFLKQEIGRAHV